MDNKKSFSKFGAILAVISSALGLGNIWKFPGMIGNNGGSLFILIYVIGSFLTALPILMLELFIGVKTKKQPVDALRILSNNNNKWQIISIMSFICTLLICAFYSDVIGWVLKYIVYSVTNKLNFNTIEEAQNMFNNVISSPSSVVFYQLLVLLLVSVILYFDAVKKIEATVKCSLSLLLVILISMFLYSITLPGIKQTIKFLFIPDFSKFSGTIFLNAIGLGFFKVSAGMMVMANYFSYFPNEQKSIKPIFNVISIDLFTSIMCGVIIFPILFTYTNEVSGGPGLLFVTSVTLFNKMKIGFILLPLFFILAFLAALGALISLVQFLYVTIENMFKISSKKANIIGTVILIIFGSLASLSTTPKLDNFIIGGKNLFDLFDFISSNIILPLTSFLLIIFILTNVGKKQFEEFLISNSSGDKEVLLIRILSFVMTYITPALILIVWYQGLR